MRDVINAVRLMLALLSWIARWTGKAVGVLIDAATPRWTAWIDHPTPSAAAQRAAAAVWAWQTILVVRVAGRTALAVGLLAIGSAPGSYGFLAAITGFFAWYGLKCRKDERLYREWAATEAGNRLILQTTVGTPRSVRMQLAHVEQVNRTQVYVRDGGICHLCGHPAAPDNWHLDHIVPLARGGEHSYANVAVSHPRCNMSKGGR